MILVEFGLGKNKQQPGMTLIEMIVCLAILAICMTAVVRSFGNFALLSAKDAEEEELTARTEQVLLELETEPFQETTGLLVGKWHYTTYENDGCYTLKVWHETQEKTYDFIIRGKPE